MSMQIKTWVLLAGDYFISKIDESGLHTSTYYHTAKFYHTKSAVERDREYADSFGIKTSIASLSLTKIQQKTKTGNVQPFVVNNGSSFAFSDKGRVQYCKTISRECFMIKKHAEEFASSIGAEVFSVLLTEEVK